jgi:4,5-DOPA dioxygenase extradiol
MKTIADFNRFTTGLKEQDSTLPVLFIGHGSPMNGIENTEFSNRWVQLAKEIPKPKAVLVISAHWLTRGTKITAMDFPPTIHDFGGFPQALFDVQYPAPGDAALARETKSLIQSTAVELDHDWGLDHGTWTIVRHMYPDATIPVLQLSIDYTKGPQYHYDLAKELAALRKKGVLIFGSGNMVHNLRMVHMPNRSADDFNKEYAYDWAAELNELFKHHILEGDHRPLIQSTAVELDHDWGLDHGTWTIVRHMYPNATIPVLQLSIDYTKGPQYHYDLAKELAALRKKGVLIFGSGNMVHNLRMVHMPNRSVDDFNKEYAYDWAAELNELFKHHILEGDHRPLIHYETLHTAAKIAIPTPDHYYPLLYTLGLQDKKDLPGIFNDKLLAGSLSMTSVKLSVA